MSHPARERRASVGQIEWLRIGGVAGVAGVEQSLVDPREPGGAARARGTRRARLPAPARQPRDTHRALQVEQLLTTWSAPVAA